MLTRIARSRAPSGVPAKVASEMLGHSSVAITLDVYSHVSPGMTQDAAERVAGLVVGDSR